MTAPFLVSSLMPTNRHIIDLCSERLNRRAFLQRSAAGLLMADFDSWAAAPAGNAPRFAPIAGSREDRIVLPHGYEHDVLIRWGDALFEDVSDLDTSAVARGSLFTAAAAAAQLRQFGSNCDAIQYFELQAGEAGGVLCVNNEYTTDWHLFPGRRAVFGTAPEHVRAHVLENPGIVAYAKAAHGISVLQIGRFDGRWRPLRNARYNRRISADTPCAVAGPARGADLLRTLADRSGTRVLGTFGNCAGGRTPWGSYLSAEENIQDYFGNATRLYASPDADPAVVRAHRRWRMWPSVSPYGWELVDRRFDMAIEPNEAFRHGWIVEIDPLDPAALPVKRTALGRFAHEAASTVVTASGHLAVYMGDDDRFEYVYKYVSRDRYEPAAGAANGALLDHGTLYVARFDADGSGEWLPLVHDERGPLNAAAGFRNQAEVLINARAAADLLGATLMDRPEDVEVHPVTGRIYVVCTRNELRSSVSRAGHYGHRDIDLGPNAANPRGRNLWGHILELSEHAGDQRATRFRWEMLLMGGDPAAELLTDTPALAPGAPGERSSFYAGQRDARSLAAFGSPDNIGFDAAGNLWIVTDGDQPDGRNNGCFVCPTAGAGRGALRQFMSGPVDAEICGCTFTPDQQTLFLSVQHPGAGGTLDGLTSHWPDGGDSLPRSSVIAVRKRGGGIIGS